jgi:hypothetical protein
VLDGYGLSDSIEITGDSVSHVASWLTHPGLPEDQPFWLWFHLENASLYSYRVQAIPEPRVLAPLGIVIAMMRRRKSA